MLYARNHDRAHEQEHANDDTDDGRETYQQLVRAPATW